MADNNQLRELAAGVQNAVDSYIKLNDVTSYKDLQAQLDRLRIASKKPSDTLFHFRTQVVENISISMLLEMGVLHTLVEKKGTTATAKELAVANGYNELVVGRLMRVATGLLFCEETDESTYAANHLTNMLVRPGWKGAMHWAEILYPVGAKAREFATTSKFTRTGDELSQCAYQFSTGQTIWNTLEQEPETRRSFDDWMRERRLHEESDWHIRYPPVRFLSNENLKNEPEDVLMVDVGGAEGSQALAFKNQFPHLPGRYVLQDLFVSKSDKMTKTTDGLEQMHYDFFTPQPIKGAKFYYFRNVFHNWPDAKSTEILRNLVPAMDPEYSTLLIDDFVLPNKGATKPGAVEDILMMLALNSLERTARQYQDLLRPAGLEIVNIYEVGSNEEAIIEAKVARW